MKVFISHASTDTELARRVADSLKEAGLQVWDGSDVLPGDNWAAEAGHALQESNAMVVLLTPESLRAPNVSHEIGYALGKEEYRGRLIPVLAGAPEDLPQHEIPWVLKRFGMIELSDAKHDEEGLRKIAEALTQAA
jgi:hypothetical protein